MCSLDQQHWNFHGNFGNLTKLRGDTLVWNMDSPVPISRTSLGMASGNSPGLILRPQHGAGEPHKRVASHNTGWEVSCKQKSNKVQTPQIRSWAVEIFLSPYWGNYGVVVIILRQRWELFPDMCITYSVCNYKAPRFFLY